MGQQAHFDPPVSEPDMDMEVAPTVSDAQFGPNEVHISEAVLEMIVGLMMLWQILLRRSL
jgi:hypothetical protein